MNDYELYYLGWVLCLKDQQQKILKDQYYHKQILTLQKHLKSFGVKTVCLNVEIVVFGILRTAVYLSGDF